MSEMALRTDFSFSTAMVSVSCSLGHVCLCVHLTVAEVCMGELVIKLRRTPVGI